MRRIALTLLAAGCSLGLAEDFEEDLRDRGGCADLYAFAVNDEDTVLLEVQLDKPLEAAAGGPASRTVSLPDPFAQVSVQLGRAISDAACDDLIINGGPKVRETWEAVSGTVTVNVVPPESLEEEATADLTLEGILLESPSGKQVQLESFDWTELSAGWFAG